jgi:hypothetical protein
MGHSEANCIDRKAIATMSKFDSVEFCPKCTIP